MSKKNNGFRSLILNILEYSSSNPKQIIITDKWKKWTWNDLMIKTASYTHILKKQPKYDSIIGVPILVGRSGNSIAAMLSCIFSGLPFSPINYKQPEIRLKKFQKSLHSNFILSGLHESEVFSDKSFNLVFPTAEYTENQICSDSFPSEKLLYILFTSGSTGEPKGVLCSCGNILNYLNWSSSHLDWRENDVIGCGTQFSFDLSMSDIFYMFSLNIPLVIFPEPSNPLDILQRINENKITHIFSVPTLFSQFLYSDLIEKLSKTKLRRMMSAGGFFPHNHMLELIRKFPNLDIYNSWGPTETTIINSIHKITKNDIKILNKGNYPSIGKPDSLMPFFLINDKNEVISKPNEIGEIVVLGNSVTLGYLNADEENDLKYSTYEKKRAFHTGDLGYKDSEENFFMVGRKDSQVKIFGYRVDLNEIEKVLAKLESVYLSIAFVQNLNESNDELWVAIESKNSNFSIFSTKKYLRTQLPHYMVPKRIFILPKIPLNENGKPDINKAKALINKGIIQN